VLTPRHAREDERQRADFLQERRVLEVDLELACRQVRQAGGNVRGLVERCGLEAEGRPGLQAQGREDQGRRDARRRRSPRSAPHRAAS
jgi:hypothetical protein